MVAQRCDWSPSPGRADGQPARCEAFTRFLWSTQKRKLHVPLRHAHRPKRSSAAWYLRRMTLTHSQRPERAEEHEKYCSVRGLQTSVFHPNPVVTLLWPQIPPVESSLLLDPAISGFVGQSGDILMAHRHRRGCRPLYGEHSWLQGAPRDGLDLCWHPD